MTKFTQNEIRARLDYFSERLRYSDSIHPFEAEAFREAYAKLQKINFYNYGELKVYVRSCEGDPYLLEVSVLPTRAKTYTYIYPDSKIAHYQTFDEPASGKVSAYELIERAAADPHRSEMEREFWKDVIKAIQ